MADLVKLSEWSDGGSRTEGLITAAAFLPTACEKQMA